MFSLGVVAWLVWQTVQAWNYTPEYPRYLSQRPAPNPGPEDSLAYLRLEALALVFRRDSLPYTCPAPVPEPCHPVGPALRVDLLKHWGGTPAVWAAMRAGVPAAAWPRTNGPVHIGSRLGQVGRHTLVTVFVADSLAQWHEVLLALPLAPGQPLRAQPLNGPTLRNTVLPDGTVVGAL